MEAFEDITTRAAQSRATFDEAAALAKANGMELFNPSDGCYQLCHKRRGWIINMYPRNNGLNPRMYHDKHHRGPFLKLPERWTLLDAVKAAIQAEDDIASQEASAFVMEQRSNA